MSVLGWVGVAGAAAALGALLTLVVLRWTDGRVVDLPNERSSHVRPTPRGGGLSIVAVVLGGLAAYGALVGRWDEVALLVAGGLMIAGISFMDDVRSAPSVVRFAVHAAAAAVVVGGLTGWNAEALPLGQSLPWAAGLLAIVWVVGLTNAYNFMDGIDGIAGTQGVVGGLAWAAVGGVVGSEATVVAGLLLAGACAGFLRYNWSPARIFMGDVGSAFLGFTFGVLPVLGDATRPGVSAAASLIFVPFVFDTVITFLRRLGRGENVFQAHRSHLYQRLTTQGRSHREVTLLYAALAVLSGVAAVAAVLLPHAALVIWGATFGTVGLVLWFAADAHERTAARQPIITEGRR